MTFCRLNLHHASTSRRPPHAVFVSNPTAPDKPKPRNANKGRMQPGNQLKGRIMRDHDRRPGGPELRQVNGLVFRRLAVRAHRAVLVRPALMHAADNGKEVANRCMGPGVLLDLCPPVCFHSRLPSACGNCFIILLSVTGWYSSEVTRCRKLLRSCRDEKMILWPQGIRNSGKWHPAISASCEAMHDLLHDIPIGNDMRPPKRNMKPPDAQRTAPTLACPPSRPRPYWP